MLTVAAVGEDRECRDYDTAWLGHGPEATDRAVNPIENERSG